MPAARPFAGRPPEARSSPPHRSPAPRSNFDGRLFLAVALDEAVRTALIDRLSQALDGRPLPGRPIAPENWHLTLRFLGETEAAAGRRLVQGLGTAPLGPPFSVGFTGLGAFPRAARAQVLWLGVGPGEDRLRALAAVVERAVVAAGFAPERRPFATHLTLSRLRPPLDMRAIVTAVPPFPARQSVDRVTLYRSHLGPAGPRYEVVETFGLAGGGTGASRPHHGRDDPAMDDTPSSA